ncbi:type VII secretion-associated serine protease mycosin [Actinoplanes sp. NPDC051470]|uniref:type VII secretion-associated serine protease mycosin n=1 Tax=unclassified Actinoplanes TaxID=2626549 RepID=UPI0034210337
MSAGVVAVLGVPATAARAGDTVRSEQWHLRTLNVAGAWTWSQGAGVTVAVIDSGVDARQVDLRGQVLPGLDLVDTEGDGDTDLVGHGTTVAAIIAGKDDAAGVAGIAPKARILPVRVLDQTNRYNDALVVAEGVRWAVDHGAKVINLSLGGGAGSAALAAAIDYAFAKDVVVVACTGNVSASTTNAVWYPAREPGVIAVSGVDRSGDALWSGSNYGRETAVTAPAAHIVGIYPDGYNKASGTSFAAPIVAGTVALVRSRWPSMPAGEVVNRILRTARDRGPEGRDEKYGFGLVDPTGALTAEVPAVEGNPLDTSPAPGHARLGTPGASGSAPLGDRAQADRAAADAGASAASPAGDESRSRLWWPAAALLLLTAGLGVAIIRRSS